MIVRVAKSWHLTPGQFRALPYQEQVEMIAEYTVMQDMTAYEEDLAERKRKVKNG